MLPNACVVVGVVAAATALAAEETGVYSVHAEGSRFQIKVGKAGLFSAFGHEHLVEVRSFKGELQLDAGAPGASSLTMEVDAASLTVVDSDVNEDERAKIQAQMEEEALEIKQFPSIRFASTSFSLERAAGIYRGAVEGELTLHGRTRVVRLPVEIVPAAGKLSARGQFKLKGSDYGVKQVTAAGGAVKTKDELELSFDFACEKRP